MFTVPYRLCDPFTKQEMDATRNPLPFVPLGKN
jgi:hypothetical protein